MMRGFEQPDLDRAAVDDYGIDQLDDASAKQEAYEAVDKEIGNDLATLQMDLEQPINHLEDPQGTFAMELLHPDDYPPVRVE